jgi:hypothetical protein
MRFLCIYRARETNQPESPEHYDEMTSLVEEMTATGVMVSTEGCLPSSLGAKVRRTGGSYAVTDGPFSEAKEVVGGFAILEAKSKEHAIELNKRFLAVAGDGEVELRQVFEAPVPSRAC